MGLNGSVLDSFFFFTVGVDSDLINAANVILQEAEHSQEAMEQWAGTDAELLNNNWKKCFKSRKWPIWLKAFLKICTP